MKIIVNENSESEFRGGLIFEAEISGNEKINPKVSFWDNQDGSVNINLHLWDSKEIVDGYSVEQTKELMYTLKCAIEFIENPTEDVNGQLNLFDEQETINKVLNEIMKGENVNG